MTPALRAAYIAAVQRDGASEHRLEPTTGDFRAKSRAQGLRAVFGERGVEVSLDRDDASWRWQPTAGAGAARVTSRPSDQRPRGLENRATYRRRGFDEW